MNMTTQPPRRTTPDRPLAIDALTPISLLTDAQRALLLRRYRLLDACARESRNPYLPAPAWMLTDDQRAELAALEGVAA